MKRALQLDDPKGVLERIEWGALSIDELKAVISKAKETIEQRVSARRAELMAELSELDQIAGKAGPSDGGGKPSSRKGLKATVTHRGPNGESWTGRGAIPRWASDLGITDRAGMVRFEV